MTKRPSDSGRNGEVYMVDVTDKAVARRRARAQAVVQMKPATLAAIEHDEIPKGEVLATARMAGIMAAKRCSEFIPLAHNLNLDVASVDFVQERKNGVLRITGEVGATARAGVEMEALAAVAVAALTVYDMVRGVDPSTRITDIRVLESTSGKGKERSRETQEGSL